jgi:hypothetical protein
MQNALETVLMETVAGQTKQKIPTSRNRTIGEGVILI